MANRKLTADVIANESLMILENELGILSTFYRPYEDEYDKTVNGYRKGATISIRRLPTSPSAPARRWICRTSSKARSP